MKLRIKILCILILSVGFLGCKKEYQKEEKIEEIGTPQITTGWHKAIIKIGLKNNNLDCYGICYAEEKVTSMPTISNDTAHLNMEGIATLSNLKDAITYYWRVFIQIEDTILYGDIQKFTTLKFPTISTTVTDITTTSAILHGTFTDGYNSDYIKLKQFYYCVSGNNNSKIIDAPEDFIMQIKDLEYDTAYDALAYVENLIGEPAYGNKVSFTTPPYYPHCPQVETLDATDITVNSAKLWGRIINEGDGYTEKGIVFGDFPNLDLNHYSLKIPVYDENDPFYVEVTRLTAGGNYYYRTYILHTTCEPNYGDTKDFKTLP